MVNAFKTIDHFDLKTKIVLVRVDFNVPMKNGKILDVTRIKRTLPTLIELMDRGSKVVVMSHFGRPNGKKDLDFSLKPIAEALSVISGKSVVMTKNCVGDGVKEIINKASSDSIILLENLRFHPGEEDNALDFAMELAGLGDCYVNDAFSCSHRAHASVEQITKLLPSAAGRLMEVELSALNKALEAPERPVSALIGGSKVSTKLAVLGNLVKRVDQIIIGGAMANTFLASKGKFIGNSLFEQDMVGEACAVLANAAESGCKIILPVDVVIATQLVEGAKKEACSVEAVKAGKVILDIGPKSVDRLVKNFSNIRTLIWNGPLGAFEYKPFDFGTNVIAQEVARLTAENNLLSIAGGGDTISALVNAGVQDKFSYVSTAGGAFLEWVEGKELPGVAVLRS